jgi:hypothetical protein
MTAQVVILCSTGAPLQLIASVEGNEQQNTEQSIG